LDALKEKGCPVCFLMAKSVHKMMDDFLYEQVNDSRIRQELHASMGFCNIHVWQLQKFGDPLGMRIIYEDLLNILEKKAKDSRELVEKHFLKPDNYQVSKAICPICKHSKKVEKMYISSFIEYFNDAEFNSNFKLSFGLCLNHLVKGLNDCHDKKVIAELKEIELQKWESLRQELNEFKRKSDYRFANEGFGAEGDAWIRAIEKMTGKEGVS